MNVNPDQPEALRIWEQLTESDELITWHTESGDCIIDIGRNVMVRMTCHYVQPYGYCPDCGHHQTCRPGDCAISCDTMDDAEEYCPETDELKSVIVYLGQESKIVESRQELQRLLQRIEHNH